MVHDLSDFRQTVREERLFCAVLFHLLLNTRTNLNLFVEAMNAQLPPDRAVGPIGDGASVYVEFTYLRDSWFALGFNNEQKRARIFSMFASTPLLARLTSSDFPEALGAFNERFMGPRGARIQSDIGYPGQWTIKGLKDSFGDSPAMFRELCRIKWSFNIKPDLVILAPNVKPICVEAKLESGEGSYPTGDDDRRIFAELGVDRVKQVELQQFMFRALLGVECQPVVVAATQIQADDAIPLLTWRELFATLDLSASPPFIQQLILENVALNRVRN